MFRDAVGLVCLYPSALPEAAFSSLLVNSMSWLDTGDTGLPCSPEKTNGFWQSDSRVKEMIRRR